MMRVVAPALLAVTVASCAASGPTVDVSDARVGVPVGPNAALYLTATATSDDRLVAAETGRAVRVE